MTTKRKSITAPEPTEPELTPDQLHGKAIGAYMLEVARSLPTLQWCKARIRYGVGSTEAGDNPEVLTIVVANELQRRETGRDAWERFEQMNAAELTQAIEAGYAAEHAGDEPADVIDSVEATKGDPV